MSVRASDGIYHQHPMGIICSALSNFQYIYIYTVTDLSRMAFQSDQSYLCPEEVATPPDLQAGEGSMIIQKPEGTLSGPSKRFVTHLCSRKYLTEKGPLNTTRISTHGQRSSTRYSSASEIAPLVHSEKVDMKRIEIEVCGQQLPNGYPCQLHDPA